MLRVAIHRPSGDTLNIYKAAAELATPVVPTSTGGGRFVNAAEASTIAASAVTSTVPTPDSSRSSSLATGTGPGGGSTTLCLI